MGVGNIFIYSSHSNFVLKILWGGVGNTFIYSSHTNFVLKIVTVYLARVVDIIVSFVFNLNFRFWYTYSRVRLFYRYIIIYISTILHNLLSSPCINFPRNDIFLVNIRPVSQYTIGFRGLDLRFKTNIF